MGAFLFEGDAAAYRGEDTIKPSAADETFTRRLADARAFGLASEKLASTYPEFSARAGLTVFQRAVGWLVLIGIVTLLLIRTDATLTGLSLMLGGVFGLIILLRLSAAIWAMSVRRTDPAPLPPGAPLWTLTILAPLLRENAAVVRSLIDALTRLDYLSNKLDVKILVEADDDATIAAVLDAQPPPWFEIIPVPPGPPRTKPKALNYGLASARGQFVAVFDAEDRPSPGQPRAAMAAFRDGGKKLAVVQAPLLIHNGADGWLARQFEAEYAIHFRVWLPFLASRGLPLALGGTSNYFRKEHLDAVGGWDAWNVTEDADIGLRLARFGKAARMIAPPTMEEAPSGAKAWMSQRTRWMKGHLQTWLVLNRQPFRAAREMGWLRFAATQLTLGGSLLASLMHGPLILWVLANALMFHSPEPWQAMLFGVGYASVIVAALAARTGAAHPWTMLTLPLYWPLQSIAMLCALIDMKRQPHFWAKTPHGAGQPQPPAPPPAPADNVIQLHFDFDA